jgi:hypothetical protein
LSATETSNTPLSKETVGKILALFLASRCWVALWVYAGHLSHPYKSAVESGYVGVDNWWLNPWTTYDSYWYLRIAERGFEPLSAGFFPFYSLLLRPAGPNPVVAAMWGFVLSNFCFAIGLIFLFRMTRLDFGDKTAWRALIITAFFPVSAVFSAVYTESLYFMLLTGTFFAFREKRWLLAGLMGFMVALSRNAGPIIAVALMLEAARLPPSRERVRAFAVSIIPLLGFVAVQGYLWLQFHGLGATKTQELYGRKLGFPWMPIWNDGVLVLSGKALDITTLLNLLVTIAAIWFIVTGWRKERPSHTVLLSGIMLAQLTLGRTSAPYTNSSLRFLMTTFPFTQQLGRATDFLTGNRLRAALSLTFLLLVCALMSFLFGQKQFVTG